VWGLPQARIHTERGVREKVARRLSSTFHLSVFAARILTVMRMHDANRETPSLSPLCSSVASKKGQ
jgi:hypothetical protein